ncbi:Replication-associated recombination protein A [Sebaldella termitidis]|jgi:putative ATPase|uniref:AAA ATPase central domain protein n=1 Tax=Sebaldella termitidis (strain ATCC 33386 / NCTC 11300) TaxID=526218 RepID=D1AFV8_SEBTE|nr:replication-associated recombination protein A [Sebaldella termitidis]ACZ07993.1 AAA ATPase central domain protein [Sebaldella termitidis ATCC 33386]MBP7979675.1 replication-associated recombination protein A [Sebaldella sp.]SUI23294.1 Replication-associated recombination protein A [Sebaldella termitidis]
MNLFENQNQDKKPLAYRYRPKTLEEFAGQKNIVGDKGVLKKILIKSRFMNSIFWGPSGTGKTTLAEIVAEQLNYYYEYLNATKASVNDIKEIAEKAKKRFSIEGKQTILFFDEIHRFNKLQQDSLLHDIEIGNIILIGATTENPYFNLNNALLSRCLMFEFKKLDKEDIFGILKRIREKEEIELSDDVLNYISDIVEGDARQAINFLELLSNLEDVNLSVDEVRQIIQTRKSYDRVEDKYDTISAMIKSIRGSDPDAAVYWVAKMLSGGEDPLYLARRLVILASEDIGLANANALPVAVAGMQAAKDIGMPEVRIILAEVAVYLALSPKSNSAYMAIDKAISEIENNSIQEVPKHLTKLGAKDYKYPHAYKGNFVKQDYMKIKIKFYEYGENKFEIAANERLKKLWGE